MRALELILQKTARAQRRPALVEGAVWASAAVLAVLASALLLAVLAPKLPMLSVWAVRLGVGGVAVGAAVALRAALAKREALDVARELQRHAPQLRGDLVSALGFGRELLSEAGLSGGFSPVLARAHVSRTTTKMLAECQSGHLAHLLPMRDLTPAIVSTMGTALLVVVPLLAAPEWTMRALTGAESPRAEVASAVASALSMTRPIVGDIQLTYVYPEYTKLQRRHEPFTTGQIEGIQGAEVTIRSYTLLARVKEVDLLLKTSDGEQTIPMKMQGPGRVEATIRLATSGSYRFRARLDGGRQVVEEAERTITVTPDAAPTIQITSHQGTVEVSPQDVLEIAFQANDDFGLSKVLRVHAMAGQDSTSPSAREPISMASGQAATATDARELAGSFRLDLSKLNLQPKDSVTLHLEAIDNNSMTGPGVGKSAPIVLRVSSPEDKHFKNIQAQQQLVEALLLALADYLEAPIGARQLDGAQTWVQVVPTNTPPAALAAQARKLQRAHEGLGALLQQMARLGKELEADPLMVKRDLTLFNALTTQLTTLHDAGDQLLDTHEGPINNGSLAPAIAQQLAAHGAKMEGALEKGVLRLRDLLASQKMDSARASAQDIKQLKQRLKDLLEKYRDSKDPQVKAQIKQEIQRLKQRMGELMRRMSEQVEQLPQEHLNMEALKDAGMESDTGKMLKAFSSIEDLLEKDDIDGALKALDQMGKSLEKLDEKMGEQFPKNAPEQLSKLDKKMGELMDAVDDLSSRQRRLEERTRKAQAASAAEQRQKTEEMTRGFAEQMQREADALKKKFNRYTGSNVVPPMARRTMQDIDQSIKNMKRSLEAGDLQAGRDEAVRVQRALEQVRASYKLALRYSDAPMSGEPLRRAQRELNPLVSDAAGMVQRFDEVLDRARKVRDEVGRREAQQLAAEQQETRKQADKLEKRIGEASADFPMLEQQLKPKMQQAKQSMDQASERLGEQNMQGGLDAEREAMRRLDDVKQSMKDALQKQRQRDDKQQGGQGVANKERVVIPKTSPTGDARYRKDVQEAMKEDRLDDYAREIELYHKSLLR